MSKNKPSPPYELSSQSYGKSRVRLTKVFRDLPVHDVCELSVDVELDGDFEASYSAGDNALVIPTDTMKNTVLAFARELDVREIERFAWTLGAHFVEDFDHVTQATVKVWQRPWERLAIDGQQHPHAFCGVSGERNTCHAIVLKPSLGEDSEGMLECGIEGLVLLKTTESGFSDFLRDQYTTLSDVGERIFATAASAHWAYSDEPDDWQAIRKRIRTILIREFAARFSPSVQKTLHEMATAVLDAESVVEEIQLAMPNLHHNLANLDAFDLDNPNVLFVPTDEPHGNITAGLRRVREGEEHHSH